MKMNFLAEAIGKCFGIRVEAEIGEKSREDARARSKSKPRRSRRRVVALTGLALLLAPLFGPDRIQADVSRVPSVQSIVDSLSSEQKAAILLNKILGVPKTRAAELLFLNNDDAVRRRVDEGLLKLKRGLNAILARSPDTSGIAEADREYLGLAAQEIADSLATVPTSGGTELMTLLANPANGVKIVGLSNDPEVIKPLLVQVPKGVLSQGAHLSVHRPVIVSPAAETDQRMVVTDARMLLSNPDGSSVYLLKTYCLDEAAHAPVLGNAYRFSQADQSLLTSEMQNILQAGDSGSMQVDLWDYMAKTAK